MIKKHLLILAALPLIFAAGCDDFLDKEPLDMYEGDFILHSEEGMDLLLNGTYDIISKSGYYGGVLYLYEASKGPDFFVRNVAGGYSFYYENRYGEGSTLNGNAKSIWNQIYLGVRNTTLLLENIDNVKGDMENIRRIKGEAYAIRGLCYFDLMRLFAYPPIFSCTWGTKYNDRYRWGVPVMNDVEMGSDIYDYQIRRQTADSTYKLIVDQFTRAANLLEGRNSTHGHVDAAAAKALLMRTNLYMQQWEEVIRLGEEWLSEYEANYGMLAYDAYTTNYYKAYNSESVWELGYTTGDNQGSNAINYWVRKQTYNEPGQERDGSISSDVGYAKLGLTSGETYRGLDFLTQHPNDIRAYLVCRMGIENKPDYRTVRRYVGDPYHFVHNIPVVRLPEIYLSLAEAYANSGDLTRASELTSKVSQPRRKANASIASATNVLNERRREFILEGHTYWDWFRTARNMSNRQIIESLDDASITFGNTTGASYRCVYPLPLAELNANPAIRDQQNPGYAAWEYAIEE